jgi:hypothetical protein
MALTVTAPTHSRAVCRTSLRGGSGVFSPQSPVLIIVINFSVGKSHTGHEAHLLPCHKGMHETEFLKEGLGEKIDSLSHGLQMLPSERCPYMF